MGPDTYSTYRPTAPLHDRLGPLDVVVLAVLKALGLPLAFEGQHGWRTLDNSCAVNAETLLDHFGTRRIAAIKEIRGVTGFGLRDAKEAFEGIEAAYISHYTHAQRARQELDNGNYNAAAMHAERAEAARNRPRL